MPKPACVACQRFMRPMKNGALVLEQMPRGGFDSPPGNSAPETWQPYKIWRCDLYRCEGCDHVVAAGWAREPMAEHFEPGFADWLPAIDVTVNDC